jgi:DNA-binding CsgD family transcriptional regulator
MSLPERSVGFEFSTVQAVIGLFVSPVAETAAALSKVLDPVVTHSSLAILAIDDVGQPRKQFGDPAITARLTLSELDKISSTLSPGTLVHRVAEVGGSPRPVLATKARSGATLVLVDPQNSEMDEFVQQLWQAVAVRIQEKAREASPTYLRESRVAASVRAEAVTELADRYTTTLETLLAILRSTNVEDRSARQAAIQVATEAAVNMRTASDRVLRFTEEPVTTAFERLKSDLRPLVRYRNVDVQFVEPPVDGRALPSEVAHGARAVVRGAILALLDQASVGRVRVQWDCDGKNLLIGVRDDGPGELSADSLELESVQQRVLALNGEVTVAATTGWGSNMSVVLPLDPPVLRSDESRLSGLSVRELQVVERVVAGDRNRAIASELGISENTVKFHLSKVFRRLNIRSRAELAAIVFDRAEPPVFAK